MNQAIVARLAERYDGLSGGVGRDVLKAASMKIIKLDQEAIRNQAIRNSIPVPDDTWDAVKDKVMALLKKWKQWPIFFEEEAFKTHLARNKDVLEMAGKLRGTDAFENLFSIFSVIVARKPEQRIASW